MEKHEAQNFIIQRLRLGEEEDEIVSNLSERLGAPKELVRRFVDQVSESHLTVDKNSLGSSFKTNRGDDPVNSHKVFLEEDPQKLDTERPFTSPEYKLQKETNQGEPPQPIQTETAPSDKPPTPEKQDEIEIEDLEAFVLKSLKKHHRYNDIVQKVCEKTGWGWKKAQLFVARTQTKNHKELTKSNRIFMIPFSSVFIIGGLLLLFWSVLAFFDYYHGLTGEIASTLPLDFIILVIAGFITSFGIIAGGIFGLYRTLSTQ